jgi:type IV pilus assembly protein PilO
MAKLTVDQIIKLPNSQKIAILGVTLAAMIGAYIFYIFMPQQDTINANRETILKLQSQYNEQQNILSNLPRFKQELKVMQAEFEESLKMLPNAREIPSLLTNISTLAQESGLEINLFQPKNEVPMDFYAQIPVEMRVTGKYHQIGVFFDKVSQLPRIINITDFSLKRKQSASKDSNVFIDAAFSATTFKFIEKTAGKPNARKK